MQPAQELQRVGDLDAFAGSKCGRSMGSTGFRCRIPCGRAVAFGLLSERKQHFIAQGEEGTAHCDKDLELVIGPLDRRDGATQSP